MQQRADWVRQQREEAWAFGRELRGDLISRFQRRYELLVSPPPAKIVDELLTDFLKVRLEFVPLGEDRYAETRWVDGNTIVTVNSRIGDMPGVKDEHGVEKVAMWHEAVHVVRDGQTLRQGPQGILPGLDAPMQVVCYRSPDRLDSPAARSREFWAEEAGRAAAVSLPALERSEAFCTLMQGAGPSRQPGAWPLLYEAARDIGVNISALVRQLSLEGWIALVQADGRQQVHVQPALFDHLASARSGSAQNKQNL